MAKTIKMCDMKPMVAAKVFEMLNPGMVHYDTSDPMCIGSLSYRLITDVEPKDLLYPEGWYYANGCFRNKHMSTTGLYYDIRMIQSNGTPWRNIATYCTLYV